MLNFNLSACSDKVASFAEATGTRRWGRSERETAEQVPQAILQLMRDLELPTTLKQVNFPKADIESFADYIVRQRQQIYNLPRYNPRRLTIENMTQLLIDMYEGALEN